MFRNDYKNVSKRPDTVGLFSSAEPPACKVEQTQIPISSLFKRFIIGFSCPGSSVNLIVKSSGLKCLEQIDEPLLGTNLFLVSVHVDKLHTVPCRLISSGFSSLKKGITNKKTPSLGFGVLSKSRLTPVWHIALN